MKCKNHENGCFWAGETHQGAKEQHIDNMEKGKLSLQSCKQDI